MLRFFRPLFKNPPGIPNYRVAPRYDISGAAAFVMEREYGEPLLYVAGPGTLTFDSLRVTQQTPLYFTFRGVQAGLGGNMAGQFALSPLSADSVGG